MAILTDGEILEFIKTKEIVVTPFRPECLGSNSYDIHLGKKLAGTLQVHENSQKRTALVARATAVHSCSFANIR